MLKKALCMLCAMLLLASCGAEEENSSPASESDASVLEQTTSEQSDADVSADESSAAESSTPEESSTPPIVIQPPETSDVPIDGEQMEGTFGKYTFVSEENGKSVAGIYSAEQIQDFATRRENGEWYTVSYEEMLFLAEDTIKLFETYDLVRMTDIDGNVHTYYGLPFYSSEEYYNCFNRLASPDDPACTFDLDQDIRDFLFMRLEVLTTSVCYDFPSVIGGPVDGFPKIIYFGMEEEMSADEMSEMSKNVWAVYNDQLGRDLHAFPYGAIMFRHTDVFVVENVSIGDTSLMQNIDPGERFAYNAGKYEYGNENQSVIVEIQETQNYYTVARIRIDDEQHLEELSSHWNALRDKMGIGKDPDDPLFQESDYRILVYFNGFPSFYGEMDRNYPTGRSIFYQADGKFNAFSLAHDGTLLSDTYHLGGCTELATSINRIVKEILSDE